MTPEQKKKDQEALDLFKETQIDFHPAMYVAATKAWNAARTSVTSGSARQIFPPRMVH